MEKKEKNDLLYEVDIDLMKNLILDENNLKHFFKVYALFLLYYIITLDEISDEDIAKIYIFLTNKSTKIVDDNLINLLQNIMNSDQLVINASKIKLELEQCIMDENNGVAYDHNKYRKLHFWNMYYYFMKKLKTDMWFTILSPAQVLTQIISLFVPNKEIKPNQIKNYNQEKFMKLLKDTYTQELNILNNNINPGNSTSKSISNHKGDLIQNLQG